MLRKLVSARVDLAGRAAQARPGEKRFQDRRRHGAVDGGDEKSAQPISPRNVVAQGLSGRNDSDARRLRGSAEVIGLIYGNKVLEGGVELRRRRRVYRQKLVIDREAGECQSQVEGLENVREIPVRCSWKRVRARRHKARISQPELDICACMRR
jgi:hypothetical protein